MDNQTDDLQTLPLTGAAPATRLRDAQAAHRILSSLQADDQPRSRARAKIRGLLDGNPPYNPAELRRLGQGYRTNLNFREASAILDARKSSYYNLVMDAEQLVKFTLRRTKAALAAARKDVRSPQDPDPIEYPEILAEEFHQTLTEWDGFLFETMRIQDEMIAYGVGPAFFPDEYDWRFRATSMNDVLVPNRAPANVEGQELVVVQTEYRVTELYAKISDPEQTKVSAKMGWNTKLLRQVIHKAYEQSGFTGTWEDVQQRVKNDDLAESFSGPKPVRLFQVFWREFDGKISLALVTTDAAEAQFLYQNIGCYDSLNQVLVLFFSGIGDGTYHSVRGLGYEIYPHCEVSNRFLNTLVDGTTLSAGVLLRQKAGNAPLVPKMLRVGPFTVLPPGFETADQGFNPNLNGILQVRDLLQNSMSNNVGQFRPSMSEVPKDQRRTAREVMVGAQKEASLEQTDVNFYYLQWDRLYRELLRRFLAPDYPENHPGWAERQAFISRCVDRGIPRALLKFEHWIIQASRSIGSGSPVMRDANSQQLLELSGFLDRKGKYQAIRNRVVTLAGPGNVDRFLGDMDRDTVPVIDSSLARMESNFMEMGKPAQAGSGEDHVAHIETHLMALDALTEQMSANPNVDYGAAALTLQLVMQHVSEHLSFLQGNPAYKADFDKYVAVLKELKALLTRWQTAAKKQQTEAQQQAEAQQGESDKVRVEVEKERIRTEATLKERMAKEDSLAANREQKTMHAMQIKEALAQQKMRLEEEKAGQGGTSE